MYSYYISTDNEYQISVFKYNSAFDCKDISITNIVTDEIVFISLKNRALLEW
jgi:hypothetical protein